MDWYLPTVYGKDGKAIEPRPKGDEVSEGRLEAFRAGQTGFPWIDAGIRQLRITGWCHHLMRHSLAAFLTRGQCWISWERGAEVSMFVDWRIVSHQLDVRRVASRLGPQFQSWKLVSIHICQCG